MTKQEMEAAIQQLRVQVGAPGPQLQAVEGGLEPLKMVLKRLRPTAKYADEVKPLVDDTDIFFDRAALKPNVGCKAENIERAWSTIVALAVESDQGADADDLKVDLKDFRSWCHDPMFLQLLNLQPELAVCWYVDVINAAFEGEEK